MAFNNKSFNTKRAKEITSVDYKDLNTLKMFVMDNGRIIPARISGVKPSAQRQIANNIKIARFLALIPYTDRHH